MVEEASPGHANTRTNQKRSTMERTHENKAMMSDNRDERLWASLRVIGWSLVAVLLLLPAIAMQFTQEVAWSIGDFIVAGVLLIGTGTLVELLLRRSRDNAYRAGAVLALVGCLLLAWSNAAVGIVGAGANVVNVLYMALIGIAIAASYAAGFTARGMAKAMIATAVGQGAILLLAFAANLVPHAGTFVTLLVNGFFLALWSAAALLFRKAAQRHADGIESR